MLITLVALAVIGAAQAQTPPVTPEARRNPNVCADVPATDITQFKNDYSACEAYFWCDGPQARPTTPCRDGFNFDEANLACDQAFVCLPCPATGTIAVGVQSDTTCRTYSFCVGGTRSTEVETCGAGTRFNRDTGLCDLEANVVCVGPGGGSGGTASCTDPVTGDPITGDVKSPAGCNRFVVSSCSFGIERFCKTSFSFASSATLALKTLHLESCHVVHCTSTL